MYLLVGPSWIDSIDNMYNDSQLWLSCRDSGNIKQNHSSFGSSSTPTLVSFPDPPRMPRMSGGSGKETTTKYDKSDITCLKSSQESFPYNTHT